MMIAAAPVSLPAVLVLGKALFERDLDLDEIPPEDLADVEWLLDPRLGGVLMLKKCGEGFYLGVVALIYHYKLVLAQLDDRTGFADVWCYATLEGAAEAMLSWDPLAGGEPAGWHRHPRTGRRA